MSKQVNPVLAIIKSKYVIFLAITWNDFLEQRIDSKFMQS